MNERQRILKLLQGGTPDRVPWFGDLDYLTGAMITRGELPQDFKQSEALFEFHRDLRVGFYLQGYFPYYTQYDGSVETESHQEGNDTISTIRTPVGTLQERQTYLPASYTSACREHKIKTPEDLPILRYIYEHMSFRPNYDEAQRRMPLVQDLGVVLCYTPKTPFMQMVVLEAGIETVVSLVMDAEDEFAHTLKTMETKLDEAVEIATASPAECLMIPENLSSEVVGKHFFETYMRACQEKWVGRIQASGKYSFIHIDGTLTGLLKEEGSVGFTVLEALTPAPVGDLPVSQWQEAADSTSILWGGIPGVYFTPQVSDRDFDSHIRDVLEVMRIEPRYVLGVADQVPPDGLLSRVRRVADLADRYGAYL